MMHRALRRRTRAAFSLFVAAWLGFILSGVMHAQGESSCTQAPAPRHAVFAAANGPVIVPLRVASAASKPVVDTDPTALPGWIDDYAIVFLEIGAAFLVLVGLLLVLIVFVDTDPRSEPDLADGDTGPWLRGEPQLFQAGEHK